MAAYEEQLTAFIDLLGTKDAILDGDDNSRRGILDLLHSLARLRSDYEKRTMQLDASTTNLYIQPSISAFSDHILISWPLSATSELNRDDPLIQVLKVSQLAGWIALRALKLGFLIRGGLAVGQLYHSSGVAFGEALIEAYRVENEISVYPRIALSPSILKHHEWLGFSDIRRDFDDGIYSLNYIFRMFANFNGAHRIEPEGTAGEWYHSICVIVRDRLRQYEELHKLKELSKWTWFARHFHACFDEYDQVIFKELGLSLDDFPRVKGEGTEGNR